MYEHQAGLIKKLSKDIARLRSVREDNEERLEEINNVADEQRVSGRGTSTSETCFCCAVFSCLGNARISSVEHWRC